jgi:hypothetical protein
MADFVAVLRKTLDGLGETTPEMRARVYDKARATVAAKLEGLNPAPPAAVADRQKKALEDAIASIESEYAPAKPTYEDPLEELESVFAALKEAKPISPPRAGSNVAPAPETHKVVPQPAAKSPQSSQKPEIAPAQASVALPGGDDDFDAFSSDERFEDRAVDEERAPRRRRSYGGLIAAVVALLVVAGAGYGIWLNKDEFSQMLGMNQPPAVPATPASDQPAAEPPQETDVAAAPPADDAATQPGTQEPASETPKFTQRLNTDGTEVDAGPAGGGQTFGEGTSVASLTTPVASDQPPTLPPAAATPPADAATPPADAAAPPAAATPPADGATPAPPADAATADPAAPAEGAERSAAADPATPADPAAPATGTPPVAAQVPAAQQIPVGQRAIFYEERTNVAEGSAEPGSIVWSLVQESPGGDLPPEPAIRAEATIPGKDVQLRMTIRRNADQTLPASHIIEVIFLTPEGFEGGGIDNVLRVSMKGSEQEAGSPLIGIPAKIADGFFLVALNDSKPEIDANLTLLRRQSWIDVPVIYKSGRRALFTMEKGIPGAKVFDEAMKAWQAASSEG